MLKKLIITQILLIVGLGCIFFLPKTYGIRESILVASLPDQVGVWTGHPVPTPEKVIRELAKDTRFDQKYYAREVPSRVGKIDVAKVFVVLSGNDMNNSIHRPERCFTAQGLTIVNSSYLDIDVGFDKKLRVRRLLSETKVGANNITYYWFCGASKITSSHYERTLTDMRDRLVTGTNQRWAYITVASDFGYEESSEHNHRARTEEETDQMLAELISSMFSSTHRVDQLEDWKKVSSLP